MRLGLCGPGRHPMPVDEYIVPDSVAFSIVYDVAKQEARRWALAHPEEPVDLYLTGLTRALLGVLTGLQEGGPRVIAIWEYVARIDDYTITTRAVVTDDVPPRLVLLDAEMIGLDAAKKIAGKV